MYSTTKTEKHHQSTHSNLNTTDFQKKVFFISKSGSQCICEHQERRCGCRRLKGKGRDIEENSFSSRSIDCIVNQHRCLPYSLVYAYIGIYSTELKKVDLSASPIQTPRLPQESMISQNAIAMLIHQDRRGDTSTIIIQTMSFTPPPGFAPSPVGVLPRPPSIIASLTGEVLSPIFLLLACCP